MKFKRRFIPPILWAVFIFIASSLSEPLFFLPQEAIQFLKSNRLFGQRLTNYTWALAHIFVYAVLALLVIRALAHKRILTSRLFWIAFAVTVLYGVSDEIHQIFVPERGFQYYDILMDGVGALIGLGVYALYRLKCAKRLDKKEEEDSL